METRIRISTSKFPQLTARQYGMENQPTIVLLHGFPADSNLWREVVPLLQDDFRILVSDLPGVGESSFSGDEVSVEALATGIAALLKEQKIEKAIIAGHSMGGYIAFAFAALFPEMVEGVSIIHSSAKADDEEKIKARRKSIELIRKGGKEAFINAMLPPLFAESFRNAHPEVIEQQRRQAMEIADATLIAFYNAMINRPERLDVLRSASFPVQWIIGAQDNLASPEKVLQQTSLANVNFVSVYPDSGHMAMLEDPQELAKDIRAFATYSTARQTEELSA